MYRLFGRSVEYSTCFQARRLVRLAVTLRIQSLKSRQSVSLRLHVTPRGAVRGLSTKGGEFA